MKNMWRQEDGYVSVVFLLIAAAVVPIIIFFLIELNQGYTAKAEIEEIADNLAWGAGWVVQEGPLSNGELKIDSTEAEARIQDMLNAQFAEGGGLFQELPAVEVAVKETETETPELITAGGVTFHTKDPAIAVSVSADVKGLFLKKKLSVNSVQAVQVVWKETEAGDGHDTVLEADPTTQIEKIVNPVVYPLDGPYPSEPIRLAAGGSLKYSNTGMLEPGLTFEEEDGSHGEVLEGREGLPEFVIPYDIPIGSLAVLHWKEMDEDLGMIDRRRVIGTVTEQLKEGYRVERLDPSI